MVIQDIYQAGIQINEQVLADLAKSELEAGNDIQAIL